MNINDLIVFLSGGGAITAAVLVVLRAAPGIAEQIGRSIAERQLRARIEEQRRLERQRGDQRRIEELEDRVADLVRELGESADRVAAAEARALAATNERAELQRRIATERPDAGRLLAPTSPPQRKDP